MGLRWTSWLLAVTLALSVKPAAGLEMPTSAESEQLAPPVLAVEPEGVTFEVRPGEDVPERTLTIANRGGQTLQWSAVPVQGLQVTPSSGALGYKEEARVRLAPAADGLPPGDARRILKFEAPGAEGTPAAVGVDLVIVPPEPSIQITSPKRTTKWDAGKTAPIRWKTEGELSGDLLVELSTDGGNTWATLGKAPAKVNGVRVTAPKKPSRSCKVRIRSPEKQMAGLSEGLFSIALPSAPPSRLEQPPAPPPVAPRARRSRFGAHIGTLIPVGLEDVESDPAQVLQLSFHLPSRSAHQWSFRGGIGMASGELVETAETYDSTVALISAERRWNWNGSGRVAPHVALGVGAFVEQTESDAGDSSTNSAGMIRTGAGLRFGRVELGANYLILIGSENAIGIVGATLGYRF